MKIRFKLILVSVALAVLLVRIDVDVNSFADLARAENIPAFFIYSAGFYLLLVLIRALHLSRRGERAV